ncbi:MAG: mechanosensitive ion channel family protein [Elusimicrobiota bacterium]
MHHLAFLQNEYFGNPVSAYTLAGVTFLAITWVFLVTRRVLRTHLPGLASDLLVQVHRHELAVVALYLAARPLELPARLDTALHAVFVLVVAYRLVGLLTTAATYAIRHAMVENSADPASRDTAAAATMLVKGVIWMAALLFALSNLGFNVTSLLAGLGIGGVAVALAAQAILGDLFSAVAIYLDKPFVVGDSIKVGDFFGTVQHIGVKTTRIRSLGGELLVFPNSSLTSSRIQNFRDLSARRVLFNFSVPLGTPAATLAKIPEQLRAITAKTPDIRFDRAHLAAILDTGFQYEVVFHVLNGDYALYMDRQQSILLGLVAALDADGIALAQPTRNVVVTGKMP